MNERIFQQITIEFYAILESVLKIYDVELFTGTDRHFLKVLLPSKKVYKISFFIKKIIYTHTEKTSG